jgi:toxin ParE1/3/4
VIEVALLPEAEEDLDDAATFLDERLSGLGDRFLASVEMSLRRLAENPYVGPLVQHDVRKLRVRRFPYNLIYRIQPARVIVLAVAHHRRRPEYWRDRR